VILTVPVCLWERFSYCSEYVGAILNVNDKKSVKY
jgi:hypothetical protein